MSSVSFSDQSAREVPWYDRMLTSHVTTKVRKHIAASTAKKD